MKNDTLRYLINHLFLPPQLPQEDDSGNAGNQAALISHISESVAAFYEGLINAGVDHQVKQCWEHLQQTLGSMYQIHTDSHIFLPELRRTVKGMQVQGELLSIIAIHFNT